MRLALALSASLLAAPACQKDETPAAPETAASEEAATTTEETAAAPTTPVHVGTVRGVVRLAEGAELPSFTSEELGNVQGGGGCPPPGGADAQPVTLGEGRALEGVMVSATGEPEAFFAQVPPHEPVERRVVIDDCRLSPRLLVALRGDRLVLQNQTQQPMFPVIGRASYADSLAFGATRTVELERAGVEAVSCGVRPACGRTDVVVVMNPVFGVTGEAGRFEMTNVPADQPITIHAWHPLFREARAETRVSEGGEAIVELVLEPRPAPAAPAE
jgi:hypothetical protein